MLAKVTKLGQLIFLSGWDKPRAKTLKGRNDTFRSSSFIRRMYSMLTCYAKIIEHNSIYLLLKIKTIYCKWNTNANIIIDVGKITLKTLSVENYNGKNWTIMQKIMCFSRWYKNMNHSSPCLNQTAINVFFKNYTKHQNCCVVYTFSFILVSLSKIFKTLGI